MVYVTTANNEVSFNRGSFSYILLWETRITKIVRYTEGCAIKSFVISKIHCSMCANVRTVVWRKTRLIFASPCLRALVSEILEQVSGNNMVIYSGHKAKRRSGVRKGNNPRMIPFLLPLVTCTITQALVLFFNSNFKNIGLVQEAPASSKTVKELK